MPTFEIGNALRNGVVDMANTTAVFHANLVPEGVALTLAERPIAELRKNGGYDLMNGIHQKKAKNILARPGCREHGISHLSFGRCRTART